MRVMVISMLAMRQSAYSTLLTPKKLCVNCKHFIANNRECAIFGTTDLVNGKIDYKYASYSRTNEDKCGEKALYYEENKYKFVTVPYYFCKAWWPIILLLVSYSAILYTNFKN